MTNLTVALPNFASDPKKKRSKERRKREKREKKKGIKEEPKEKYVALEWCTAQRTVVAQNVRL